MDESHLHCHIHLFQLYFDSEFFITTYVLKEPFFDTLPCNKDLLLPNSFHLLNSFKTHKGYCHIYQLENTSIPNKVHCCLSCISCINLEIYVLLLNGSGSLITVWDDMLMLSMEVNDGFLMTAS